MFYECSVARELWAWVARVLFRATGTDITSAELTPCAGVTPLRLAMRFDGASRHDTGVGRGPGGGGALLRNQRDEQIVWCGSEHMPLCTNNEAEWRGLVLGLRAAVEAGSHALDIGGDSQLVLEQLSGKSEVRCETFRKDYDEARALISRIPIVTFSKLPREWNTAADLQANLAADGESREVWEMGWPRKRPRSEPRPGRSTLPDMATCLLGVRPNLVEASVGTPVDWFQIIRLSTLQHLYDSRNEALNGGHQVSVDSIRRRVSRDFIRRVQLRWSANLPCGRLSTRELLQTGVDQKKATQSDFRNITNW